MKGQLLLVGMSDSGTNWLAKTIVDAARQPLRYCREFFNPICNLRYAPTLVKGWGCEVPSTIPMLARASETQPELQAIYDLTWRKEAYTFTKENYSVWKLGFLRQHFDLVAIYREASSLWPPARLRVITWYNAVYESIQMNRGGYDSAFVADVLRYRDGLSIAQRAEAGHALSVNYLLRECARLSVPVMPYSWCLTASEAELVQYARSTTLKDYVIPAQWARAVVTTRRPPDHSDLTEVWEVCR